MPRAAAFARPSRLFGALGIVLALAIVAQIVNANVLSDGGDATQYGRVDVPGSAVLRLPAGSIEVLTHQYGTGSTKTPPGLELSVRRVGGDGPPATLTRDRGSEFGMTNRYGNDLTYRRIYRLHVPAAAAYEVRAATTERDGAYELGFGHSPPVSAWTIWEIMLAVWAVVLLAWLGLRFAVLRRGRASRR